MLREAPLFLLPPLSDAWLPAHLQEELADRWEESWAIDMVLIERKTLPKEMLHLLLRSTPDVETVSTCRQLCHLVAVGSKFASPAESPQCCFVAVDSTRAREAKVLERHLLH